MATYLQDERHADMAYELTLAEAQDAAERAAHATEHAPDPTCQGCGLTPTNVRADGTYVGPFGPIPLSVGPDTLAILRRADRAISRHLPQ